MTAAEMREAGQVWLARQMDKAQAKHGANWPAVREWVHDYLREELRLRLAARGVEANP